MSRRRFRQPKPERIQYMNLVGLILYQLIVFGFVAVTLFFINRDGWKNGMIFFIVFVALLQIILIGFWVERSKALKKLAEWKAQGLEVRRYDYSRRHYYKV